MTRLLSSCTAAAFLLAAGVANAQPSVSPNATAPANPALSGTAGARATMPAPAPMAAPMPAAAPAAAPMGKPMAHHGRTMHHARMKHMAKGHAPMGRAMGRGVPREQGSSAVDALNDQSLARARNGQ